MRNLRGCAWQRHPANEPAMDDIFPAGTGRTGDPEPGCATPEPHRGDQQHAGGAWDQPGDADIDHRQCPQSVTDTDSVSTGRQQPWNPGKSNCLYKRHGCYINNNKIIIIITINQC